MKFMGKEKQIAGVKLEALLRAGEPDKMDGANVGKNGTWAAKGDSAGKLQSHFYCMAGVENKLHSGEEPRHRNLWQLLVIR